MSLSELVWTYDFCKVVDAIVVSFVLGSALRLVLTERLHSIDALQHWLRTAPFARLVPYLGPFAVFNVLVAALGFVSASRANMGLLEVVNHAIFPLAAAMLTLSALNFRSDRAVPRTGRS